METEIDAVFIARWEDIPEYLKSSALALSLQGSDDEPFEVPSQYYMSDDELARKLNPNGSFSECYYANAYIWENPQYIADTLTILTQISHYWGLDNPPRIAIDWANNIHEAFHTSAVRMKLSDTVKRKLYDYFADVYERYSDMYLFLKVLNYIVIYGKKRGLPEFLEYIIGGDNSHSVNNILKIVQVYPEYRHSDWMSLAIHRRSFELFQQLHLLGVPWAKNTYEEAANAGHPYLAFAHEHGCPRNDSAAMCRAIQTLNVNSVKYMHEHGNSKWDDMCWIVLIDVAVYTPDEIERADKLMRYMLDQQCPIPGDLYGIPRANICMENETRIHMFELLCKYRVAVNPATFVSGTYENKELCKCAIYSDNARILKHLHLKQCYTMDIELVAYAISRNSIDCLKYISNEMQFAIYIEHGDIKVAIIQLISNYGSDTKVFNWIRYTFPNAKLYDVERHIRRTHTFII